MPNQPRSSANNYYRLPLTILAIVIVLLLGVSIFVLTPKIQTNLAEDIRKELVKNKIPANITLSGRDVTLHGLVSSESDIKKAETITKKICGIRFVDNQLLTDKPENRTLLAKKSSSEDEEPSEQKKVAELEKVSEPIKIAEPQKLPELKKITKEPEKQGSLKKPEPRNKPEVDSEIASESVKEVEVAEDASSSSISPSNKLSPILSTDDRDTGNNETDNSDAALVVATNDQSVDIEPPTKVVTNNSLDKSTTPKSKVLNYDTMLAAMNAYNKKKGRNPVRRLDLKKIDLQFEGGSEKILEQSRSKTVLNNLVVSLKKSKNNSMEIVVTAATIKLGIARAKSIKDYLVTKGIDYKRISVLGKSGKESVEIKEN